MKKTLIFPGDQTVDFYAQISTKTIRSLLSSIWLRFSVEKSEFASVHRKLPGAVCLSTAARQPNFILGTVCSDFCLNGSNSSVNCYEATRFVKMIKFAQKLHSIHAIADSIFVCFSDQDHFLMTISRLVKFSTHSICFETMKWGLCRFRKKIEENRVFTDAVK